MSKQENPFTGPQLQNSEYAKADMTGSNFNGVNLAKSKFYAVLTEAEFRDTNLAGAKFEDVNLSRAQFHDINLSGGSFSNINLSNAAITDAKLDGMTIEGVLVSDLFAAWEAKGSEG